MRGLHPVYLVQCHFLLYSLLLCVAYSCAVVDEKDHTTGAIHSPVGCCAADGALSSSGPGARSSP
ncbi:MAG: hypothetical protein ACK56F_12305 [bacterium]